MNARISAALLCVATVLGAQSHKPILGTVTEFKSSSFALGIRSDAGETVFVPFGTETEVVQVAPSEHDLSKAVPAAVTGILPGDRVMVSFVAGTPEARRIVVIASRDIAKRNEAEKLDWQNRGISGIAASRTATAIAVEIRTPQVRRTAIVGVSRKTKVRRYAPDSVKFSDSIEATIAEISPGDQVRARGLKSADGSTLAAEEIVFGTFLTRLGPITAIRREAHEIQIQDLATKQPLTVRLTADSHLKMMPEMRATMFGRGHEPAAAAPEKPFDIQATMEHLPAARIEDLKVGASIIVTSTKGAKSDTVTAILLLANADFLVQMARGETGLDAINQLHGGMLSGPSGLSLPTMIQ